MENVFAGRQVYGEGWSLVNSRNFNETEISAVKNNSVVNSQYGKSVCFFMKSGGMTFIPVSRNSDPAIGSSIDMTTAKLLTLERTGDGTVMRVEI